MVSMIRDGAISPSELLEAHLRQIEVANPSLNAFVLLRPGEARAEAACASSRWCAVNLSGCSTGSP